MGLSDLEKKLHTRDEKFREPHEKSKFLPGHVLEGAEVQLAKTSAWKEVRRNFFRENSAAIRMGTIALGGIVLCTLLIGTFVRIQQSLFSENRVKVSITGPENVNSSNLVTFVISYENANRSTLSNAELIVSYPPNFYPEGNENSFQHDTSSNIMTIGVIPAFTEKSLEFSGKFYGSKNSIAYIRAELRYHPKNLESRFSATGQKSVNIRSASLVIELEAPLTVSPQGEVTYLVNYENTSDISFSNVRLKASYPSGFVFTEAEPKPAEGDVVWYVGNVGPKERGRIRIVGMLDGTSSEVKTFRVEMGTFQGDNTFLSYSDAERTTQMVAPPFSIRQSLNGLASPAVNPGSNLNYIITYRNESMIALREVIVMVELDGDALDFSQLRPLGGAYDSARKVIIWKASDKKELANLVPGASGSVEFIVPIRSDLLSKNPTDKNFQVKTVAKIESPDIPNPAGANKIVATNTMWTKVNSQFFLETLGAYKDENISNTGPIPPVVGKETTYTLRWILSNTTNDVKNVEVSADLPTNARWTGKTFPSSESISYNERTNKIVWNVGNLEVGTGILSPKKIVSFQVLILPEVNDVDRSVALLGVSQIKATDIFTNETVRLESREKTTELREDISIPWNGYRVIEE